MKVLVSGGTGFIGRAFVEALHRQGVAVRLATRKKVEGPAEVENTVVGDIGSQTNWQDALEGCDTVVHLAARVHVMRDFAANPDTEFKLVNTEGTLRLAQEAAKAGVKRFLFLSSVKVNGEGRLVPYTEADTPVPEDSYGRSKAQAEAGLRKIATQTGMEIVILRPPLVYGPEVGGNFLRLMKAVAKGFPLPFGLIENRRSFLYRGNLVDAMSLCLAHPAAANKTYLLSDAEDLSTPELIRRLAKAMNCPARLWSIPPSVLRIAGDFCGKGQEIDRLLTSLTINDGAIRRDIKWKPPFSLEAGLTETARWYKKG